MKRMLALALALAVGAAAVLALADGTIAMVVALALAGLAGVIAVEAVFYEVGRSEDRAREREAARRADRPR